MSDLWFTEDHEWVRIEDGDVAVVGITDYAQEQLGELVFVELPEVGAELDQGEEGAVIESVKAAGELKLPVSGTVTEVNESLVDEPGLVNADPVGDGWFFRLRIKDASELDGLMDEPALCGLARIARLSACTVDGTATRNLRGPRPTRQRARTGFAPCDRDAG